MNVFAKTGEHGRMEKKKVNITIPELVDRLIQTEETFKIIYPLGEQTYGVDAKIINDEFVSKYTLTELASKMENSETPSYQEWPNIRTAMIDFLEFYEGKTGITLYDGEIPPMERDRRTIISSGSIKVVSSGLSFLIVPQGNQKITFEYGREFPTLKQLYVGILGAINKSPKIAQLFQHYYQHTLEVDIEPNYFATCYRFEIGLLGDIVHVFRESQSGRILCKTKGSFAPDVLLMLSELVVLEYEDISKIEETKIVEVDKLLENSNFANARIAASPTYYVTDLISKGGKT